MCDRRVREKFIPDLMVFLILFCCQTIGDSQQYDSTKAIDANDRFPGSTMTNWDLDRW